MSSIADIQVKIPLKVTIVGAGIGGLAAATACARAGMKVDVYESAGHLAEIGAGIQIGPNLCRLLRRWGILDRLRPQAVSLQALSLRRYEDDDELARISMTAVEEKYGAPIWVAHRADLLQVLKIRAEELGVIIHTNSLVDEIDFTHTRVQIRGQIDWITSDVIVAADGVKSNIRKKMLLQNNQMDQIRETGDAAWRVMISAEKIYQSQDSSLIEVLESSAGWRWMGPDGHIMCYPIRNHQLLNMVLLHPDRHDTEESWTVKVEKSRMIEFYEKWNSRVKKLIDLVPEGEVWEWKLCDHAPLNTWITDQVALLGDAAHPMLPYVAQGAAQAVEDGAVLAACLSMIDGSDQIHLALKVYELVRKERAETVQLSATKTRRALHLHDGEQQRARDQLFRNVVHAGQSPDLWSDPSFQAWCWGTDTEKQTIDMWNELVKLVSSGEDFHSPFSTKNLSWIQKL